MGSLDRASDAALLRSTEPEAFGVFYRRHLPWVLRWLVGRLNDRELAADLAGEVFASALTARASFDPGFSSAEPWLQTIARNALIDSLRRGQVEDRVRRELGIASLALTDADLAEVTDLIDQIGDVPWATLALDVLPSEQSHAIRARIVDEQGYEDIAVRLQCSPAVVRQRVSRGLKAMRAILEEGS